jgi:hypothetical protein
MADWQPDSWGIQEEPQITAPEAQAGMGYSIRYVLPRGDDGLIPMITVGFYCEDMWQNGGVPSDPDNLALSNPPPAEERYTIGQVVTFDVRRDVEQDQIGDWSDLRHRSFWFTQAQLLTDEEIKSVMEYFDEHRDTLILWDGADTSDAALSLGAEPIDPENWETYVLPPKLWKRIGNAIWLRETFEYQGCDECGLDADAHTVGPDPFGHRHAWCNIGHDPAFALKIARENSGKGDSASDEGLRRQRFEAAVYALDEKHLLDERAEEVLFWRRMAKAEVPPAKPHVPADGMRYLNALFTEIEQKLGQANETPEAAG